MKLKKLLCSFLAIIMVVSSFAGLSSIAASAQGIDELEDIVSRINDIHYDRFDYSSGAWEEFINEILDIQEDYYACLDLVVPESVDDISTDEEIKNAAALCLSVDESDSISTSSLERLVNRLENAYYVLKDSPESPTPDMIQEMIDFFGDLDSDTRESYRKTMSSNIDLPLSEDPPSMYDVAKASKGYLKFGDRKTFISFAFEDNIPNYANPSDADAAYDELIKVYDYYFVDDKASAPVVSLKQVSKDLQVRNVENQDDCTADTSGGIYYYKQGINDTVAFYVYDKPGCTSTVTINGEDYTSGEDYVIEKRQALFIRVTTEQEGKSYNVKNYEVRVSEKYYTGTLNSDGTSNRNPSSNVDNDTADSTTSNDVNKPASGWVETKQGWKYLDKDGKAMTGWVKDTDGKWYYINPSTEIMATGWVLDAGTWYFLRSDGSMLTGWLLNGGKWYYMNSSGAMATGWAYTGGSWYYLFANGQMATGWLANGGKWYYLNSSGAMVTGAQMINGTRYVFNASGAMM